MIERQFSFQIKHFALNLVHDRGVQSALKFKEFTCLRKTSIECIFKISIYNSCLLGFFFFWGGGGGGGGKGTQD